MTQAAVAASNASLMTTPVGTAPSYMARAWVNFNGTGTVAIRASGNVSSITDNGTGDYTINFATAMADVSYAFNGSGPVEGAYFSTTVEFSPTTYSTSACRFRVFGWTTGNSGVPFDATIVGVSIFR